LNTKDRNLRQVLACVSRRICGAIPDFTVMKKTAARLNQGGGFLCLTQ
jgi:hypothetical protein